MTFLPELKGLKPSSFLSVEAISWILQNVDGVNSKEQAIQLCQVSGFDFQLSLVSSSFNVEASWIVSLNFMSRKAYDKDFFLSFLFLTCGFKKLLLLSSRRTQLSPFTNYKPMPAFSDKFFSLRDKVAGLLLVMEGVRLRIQWSLEFRKPHHSKTRPKFLNKINACESCSLVPRVLFLTSQAWRNNRSLCDR